MDTEKNNRKNIDLGSYPVGRLIARLALPAVIAQLINLLYNLVDRMYVSNIPETGMNALAGLGVVFPITLIVSAFANLIGMGGAPLAGIRTGEGRRDEAEKIFGHYVEQINLENAKTQGNDQD